MIRLTEGLVHLNPAYRRACSSQYIYILITGQAARQLVLINALTRIKIMFRSSSYLQLWLTAWLAYLGCNGLMGVFPFPFPFLLFYWFALFELDSIFNLRLIIGTVKLDCTDSKENSSCKMGLSLGTPMSMEKKQECGETLWNYDLGGAWTLYMNIMHWVHLCRLF